MTVMKPTLLILAAGIGSRYGGLKQIDTVGPSGEAIIDYSIYDAIRAGFGKILFVIREEIEKDMKEVFADKLKGRIEFDFVFQELDMVPEDIEYSPERIKPWGTAHAVLVATRKIREPFAVVNADDFYGMDSYVQIVRYMINESENSSSKYCMIGYKVHDTLSDFGSVSRGICEADENEFLKEVVERTEIVKLNKGIHYKNDSGNDIPLTGNELVSMNIWGFTPTVFDYIKLHFTDFIKKNAFNIKAELFIPTVINDLIRNQIATVKILPTNDKWFGVTYREDKALAENKINELISRGVYPENLWK